jgi:uncharacterized protein (TIGR03435 family)
MCQSGQSKIPWMMRTRRTCTISLFAALVFVSSLASAQTIAPAEPAPRYSNPVTPEQEALAKSIHFEVATFKPSGPNSVRSLGFTPDSFTMGARPFHDLIRFSYARVRGGSFRLSGQPTWVDTDLYDIQAKVTPESIAAWQKLDAAEQKVVLQQFLADYLKLKVHEDTARYPYYGLIVGKNGIKMKSYEPGDTIRMPNGRVLGGPDNQPTGTGFLEWASGSEVLGLNCNMQRLADQLAGHADRGVLDETSLKGGFNFDLHFNDLTDEAHPETPIPFVALKHEDATPAIRSAIKQIGLELRPTTGQMDGVVVDHVERPEN